MRRADIDRAPQRRPAPRLSGGRRAVPPAGSTQRRQVSVLFCDLARSAELAARVDPEDLRDVLHAYLNAFAARIEAAGGFIARYMGDGVLAYFGYPLAREGDPARAVRAALAVVRAAQDLAPPHGHVLSVRCGIATGLSIVGDLVGNGASSERGVIGTAPNLAARLQAVAGAGEIVVCATTVRLTLGQFALRDLGPLDLKGFSSPEPASVVLGEGDVLQRHGLRLDGRRPVMAGRRRELAALQSAWARASAGHPTLVTVIGEAGIGKSRLLQEFRGTLGGISHHWIQAGGDPTLEGEPLGLARRILRASFGADGRLTRADVETSLQGAGLSVERALPLVVEIAGIAADERHGDPTLRAEDRWRRMNATLVDWLFGLARRRPIVAVIEDLQWADPASLELLRTAVARRAHAPLMIVLTARDDFQLPWRFAMTPRAIRLRRLTDADIGALAASVAGETAKAEQLDSIVRRAEGNPLFAEELALHVGRNAPGAGDIPDTLAGLLTARLDATGAPATLARTASVLGPHIDAERLARLTRMPAKRIARELASLARSGLLIPLDGGYAFRHALIREAAYASLLKQDRRTLHRRAARALARSPDVPAATLAWHWQEAGDPRRAVDSYAGIARRAVAEHSYGEAAQAFRSALACLQDLPRSEGRDREELSMLSALTSALQITDGYAAPAPVETAARARQIAEDLGDSAKLFTQLSSAWMAASSAGNYDMARDLVGRAMPLAQAAAAPEILGTAYMMQMTSAYRVGALAEGEAAFRAGSAHFRHPAFIRRPGALPQIYGNAAVNAWLLGQDAVARRRLARVATAARTADTPYARAFAGYMAAMQYVLMEEAESAAELAHRAMTASDEGGFPQFAATSRIVLGRALAMTGKRRKGIALLTDGLDRMGVNRSMNGMTMYMTWLAQTQMEGRERAAARATCERALAVNPSERFFRAETLRIRALSGSSREDGARDLREAIDLAHAIGSAWQEQRALAALRGLAPQRLDDRVLRRQP